MNETERIEEITQRLASNAYFVHPLSDANVRDDIGYLVGLIGEKNAKIEQLEKKNAVIAQHNLELAQEMENIKSDFGGDMR
jgi:hypothetical protein